MSKTSGLGDNFYIGGYNLSGDISSLDQITGPQDTLDVTPINAYAHVRIPGQRAGDMQFTSFFDAAAGAEHPVLSSLPTTNTIATYFRGAAIGNPAASVLGVQIDYAPTRGADGSLTNKTEVQSNAYGLEWGIQLTAGPRTDTTATVGSPYNTGQTWSYGAQAYLQLLSFTGTSVTVGINQATTSGGSYTSLISFGAQTAIGAFRGTATGSVDQYLEVTTTGTFTSAVFAVMIVLNPVAVVF
jgi:hypothetical protein